LPTPASGAPMVQMPTFVLAPVNVDPEVHSIYHFPPLWDVAERTPLSPVDVSVAIRLPPESVI